jgi:hypothetical protein
VLPLAQSNSKLDVLGILDRIAQIGLAFGIALALQPWWDHGLRVGFFLTLWTTILHIITSHTIPEPKEEL